MVELSSQSPNHGEGEDGQYSSFLGSQQGEREVIRMTAVGWAGWGPVELERKASEASGARLA